MPPRLNITALGSSFAAGPSIEPIENHAAGRSTRNYAHQLADKLNAELTDLTVSGATLLNILSEKQATGEVIFNPQLDHLPSNTDAVTITCGGNDIGYIGSLVHQALVSHVGPQSPLVTGSALTAPSLDSSELRKRLVATVDKIHLIAPKAKVYLVQYLSVFGNDTRPVYDVALTTEHIQHFNKVARMLAQSYVDAAQERPDFVAVVPVADASRDHGLGSAVPWVRGFSVDMLSQGPAPYHPNISGHTAVAEMVYKQILGESQHIGC